MRYNSVLWIRDSQVVYRPCLAWYSLYHIPLAHTPTPRPHYAFLIQQLQREGREGLSTVLIRGNISEMLTAGNNGTSSHGDHKVALEYKCLRKTEEPVKNQEVLYLY